MEDGKLRKIMNLLEPIKPISVFSYRCDSHFLTEPLKEMLETSEKYGFIIVDGNGALFAVVQGSYQEELLRYGVSLPKKHNKGGQSALRFARLRTEARHNYLTKVAELAVKLFIDDQTSKPKVSGLILAGSAEFKDQLNDSKILDARLHALVIGVVDVAYGFKAGFQQAIELSSETLKGVSIIKQKKILQKFFNEIAQDTGKMCFGVNEVMQALEAGAAETLLIWDNCAIHRFVVQGADGKQEVRFANGENLVLSKDNDNPQEIIESVSLVEWFADHYKEFGAELEIVQDSSAEGSQFCKGFGGVGALLRYKMDFSLDDTVNHSKEEVESDDDSEDYF